MSKFVFSLPAAFILPGVMCRVWCFFQAYFDSCPCVYIKRSTQHSPHPPTLLELSPLLKGFLLPPYSRGCAPDVLKGMGGPPMRKDVGAGVIGSAFQGSATEGDGFSIEARDSLASFAVTWCGSENFVPIYLAYCCVTPGQSQFLGDGK